MMKMKVSNAHRWLTIFPLIVTLSACGDDGMLTNYDSAMTFLKSSGYNLIMADPKPARRWSTGESFWFMAVKDGKEFEGRIMEKRDADGMLIWLIR